MQNTAINIIREELEKRGIKVLKILLFGSRARGDFEEDSDWDFLIIIDKEIEHRQRREIIGDIYKNLAKIDGSYEIIIKQQSVFEKMKNLIGCVSYDADKDGVIVWKS